MKVLLINGSPHANGNTSIALTEVAKTLEAEGIETVTIGIGVQPVRGCVACGACRKNNTRCAFSDALYDQLHAILEAGKMGIRNAMNYNSTEAGTREMWEREKRSRENFMTGARRGESVKSLKEGYFEKKEE